MVIKDMFLIVLHPNNETYLKKRLNRMDEEVEAMMATRLISH
jgi:guanylate kinase